MTNTPEGILSLGYLYQLQNAFSYANCEIVMVIHLPPLKPGGGLKPGGPLLKPGGGPLKPGGPPNPGGGGYDPDGGGPPYPLGGW